MDKIERAEGRGLGRQGEEPVERLSRTGMTGVGDRETNIQSLEGKLTDLWDKRSGTSRSPEGLFQDIKID